MRFSFFLFLIIFCAENSAAQNKKRVDSLLAVIASSAPDTSKARCNCKLSAEYKHNDTVLTKKYAYEGVRISEAQNYHFGLLMCWTNLADMYSERSNYTAALPCYLNAIRNFRFQKDISSLAYLKKELGRAYSALSMRDLALKNLLEAKQIYENLKKERSVYNTNMIISDLFYSDEKYTEALKYMDEALSISLKIKDSAYICNAYMNIGLMYSELKKYDLAMNCYEKSLFLNEKMNNEENLETIFMDMGVLYSRMRKQQEAFEFYNKALAIARKLKIREDVCILVNDVADILIQQQKYTEAIPVAEEGFLLAKDLGLCEKIEDAADVLARAYAGLRNFAKAYEYQKLCSDMKDSVYKTESNKNTAQMQAMYNSEKKEKKMKS